MKIKVHKDGTAPKTKGTIFVFGSNLGGLHGGGAAKAALDKFGAEWGVPIGITGSSYAIPTKSAQFQTLSMAKVKKYVADFIKYAKANQDTQFWITRVGCVLAGYTNEDIAPLFKPALPNCDYPEEWVPFVT